MSTSNRPRRLEDLGAEDSDAVQCTCETGPSTENLWRTLVRVIRVTKNHCVVTVPAHPVKRTVKIPLSDFPEICRKALAPGVRLHAYVNIGVDSPADFKFSDWQLGDNESKLVVSGTAAWNLALAAVNSNTEVEYYAASQKLVKALREIRRTCGALALTRVANAGKLLDAFAARVNIIRQTQGLSDFEDVDDLEEHLCKAKALKRVAKKRAKCP